MKIKDLPPNLQRLKFGSQLVTEIVLARGSIVSARLCLANRRRTAEITAASMSGTLCQRIPEELSNEISYSVYLTVGGQSDVAGNGSAIAWRQSATRCHIVAEQLATIVIFNIFEPGCQLRSEYDGAAATRA
jgi:hypothetical protein